MIMLSRRSLRWSFCCVLTSVASLTIGSSVQAGLILAVEPTSGSVQAGGSGSFEMTLTNTGPTTVNIATFNYELSILTAAPLSLISVSAATKLHPYLFGTKGAGIDFIANPLGTSTACNVSDFLLAAVPSAAPVALAANSSASLGLFAFSVAAGAKPQSIAIGINNTIDVTFVAATNFGTITPIAITTGTGGRITVAASVPEPASLVLVLVGLGVGLSGGVIRRRDRWSVRI